MLSSNFICTCGHRNKMHTSVEEAKKYGHHMGRMCIEFKDAIWVNGLCYHNREEICSCPDFVPDNLRTLEIMSEEVVQSSQV